jgi:hypothetical protein
MTDAERVGMDATLASLPVARDLPEWIRACQGRVYVDAVGRRWCVSERPRRQDDPPPKTCLVFMSEHVVRRVLHFPPDWRLRSDTELEAMSWQR